MKALQHVLKQRGALISLARSSGVNQSTIGRIARGEIQNPGVETMRKIEAALAGGKPSSRRKPAPIKTKSKRPAQKAA